MKRIIVLLFAMVMTMSIAHAQSPKDLKGPEAKNYKIWQDSDREITPIFTATNKVELSSPEAKNKNMAEFREKADFSTPVIFGSERTALKGPAAKNYKPWKASHEAKSKDKK